MRAADPEIVQRIVHDLTKTLTESVESEDASVEDMLSAAFTLAQRMVIGVIGVKPDAAPQLERELIYPLIDALFPRLEPPTSPSDRN